MEQHGQLSEKSQREAQKLADELIEIATRLHSLLEREVHDSKYTIILPYSTGPLVSLKDGAALIYRRDPSDDGDFHILYTASKVYPTESGEDYNKWQLAHLLETALIATKLSTNRFEFRHEPRNVRGSDK